MSELSRAVQQLRKFALGYPEAVEDFPWGDRTIKVRGKIFAFLGQGDDTLNLTVPNPDYGAGRVNAFKAVGVSSVVVPVGVGYAVALAVTADGCDVLTGISKDLTVIE